MSNRRNLLVSYDLRILLVCAALCSANPAASQDRLVPSGRSSGDAYEHALRTVFKEAYDHKVRVRVLIQGSYMPETVTGIQADSIGYQLFHLHPEKSIWSETWVDVPCSNPSLNATCSKQDFSNVDSIRVSRTQVSIDSTTARKLIRLWQEMIIRSTYDQSISISTGGVSYTYSAFKFGIGFMHGHGQNPEEGTLSGDLALISEWMRIASRVESQVTADSLIHQIDGMADRLLAALLDHGKLAPAMGGSNRGLRGCESRYRNKVENEFCWQTFLTDDEIPNLIIAKKQDGGYRYELVDLTDPQNLKAIHILPVMTLYSSFMSGDAPGWQEYPLEPWDIVDVSTMVRSNKVRLFGYRKFTLRNSDVRYGPDTVIITFDGVNSGRELSQRLIIQGDQEWFDAKSLFSIE